MLKSCKILGACISTSLLFLSITIADGQCFEKEQNVYKNKELVPGKDNAERWTFVIGQIPTLINKTDLQVVEIFGQSIISERRRIQNASTSLDDLVKPYEYVVSQQKVESNLFDIVKIVIETFRGRVCTIRFEKSEAKFGEANILDGPDTYKNFAPSLYEK